MFAEGHAPDAPANTEVVKMSELETEEDVKIDEAEASAQVAAQESSADAQSAEAEAAPAAGEQDEATGEGPDGKDRAKPNSDHVPRARLNKQILKTRKKDERIAELEALLNERSGSKSTASDAEKALQDGGIAPTRPRPDLVDVGYDDAKLKVEDAKWISEQIQAGVSAELKKAEIQKAQEESRRKEGERSAAYQKREDEYLAANPSYADAVEEAGNPTYPKHIGDAILDSEIGPKLDHELLKDAELRGRILSLPPAKALVELGKLEYRLSQAQPAKGATKPRITNAPPAIDRTAGSGGGRRDDFFDHCPGATFE